MKALEEGPSSFKVSKTLNDIFVTLIFDILTTLIIMGSVGIHAGSKISGIYKKSGLSV